jgi:hypothetical protein
MSSFICRIICSITFGTLKARLNEQSTDLCDRVYPVRGSAEIAADDALPGSAWEKIVSFLGSDLTVQPPFTVPWNNGTLNGRVFFFASAATPRISLFVLRSPFNAGPFTAGRRKFHVFLRNGTSCRSVQFRQAGVQNYTPEMCVMGRNGVSQVRAARRKEVLASIGRGLRDAYRAAEPLSDRLSALVSKIQQSAGESEADPPRR